jgi:DNA-binding transcriptional MerR regulator
MVSEYRAHTYSGMERAGDSTEASDEQGSPDGLTIGELARESGVTMRALRFYQSKGLLTPQRNGSARMFSIQDRDRLAMILQGKRLGFTLNEIRDMLAAAVRGCTNVLPIGRRKCAEQIAMLERQQREIDSALAELRQIYNEMFVAPDAPQRVKVTASSKA